MLGCLGRDFAEVPDVPEAKVLRHDREALDESVRKIMQIIEIILEKYVLCTKDSGGLGVYYEERGPEFAYRLCCKKLEDQHKWKTGRLRREKLAWIKERNNVTDAKRVGVRAA